VPQLIFGVSKISFVFSLPLNSRRHFHTQEDIKLVRSIPFSSRGLPLPERMSTLLSNLVSFCFQGHRPSFFPSVLVRMNDAVWLFCKGDRNCQLFLSHHLEKPAFSEISLPPADDRFLSPQPRRCLKRFLRRNDVCGSREYSFSFSNDETVVSFFPPSPQPIFSPTSVMRNISFPVTFPFSYPLLGNEGRRGRPSSFSVAPVLTFWMELRYYALPFAGRSPFFYVRPEKVSSSRSIPFSPFLLSGRSFSTPRHRRLGPVRAR